MRHQEQQTDTDVIRSEPVPVTGPDQIDGRQRDRYPEGTGDQGPDALDERGSYDNDLATSGSEPAFSADATTSARTRDDRRVENRSAEEQAEDAALDDDALDERSPASRTGDLDRDGAGTGDRGDLADASQVHASQTDVTAGTGAAEHTDNAEHTDDDTRKVPVTAGADTGKDADADPDATARVDDTEWTDDADGARGDARDRSGASEFHEPAPLPTSFGATSVGGAVASSALAGSHRDPRNEDTVRSGDGPVDDRIDGVGDDRIDGVEPDSPGRPAPEGSAVGVAHPVNPDVFSAGNPDAVAGGAGTRTEADGPGDTSTVDDTVDGTAVTADGNLPPGAAPAEPIVAILDQETVRGLRDRWRDVQLRFVDDPPGATEEAHRLVRESVEAVTAALTRQRDELGGWQDEGAADTEQLRMVVRRHRDFLDRLLGQ